MRYAYNTLDGATQYMQQFDDLSNCLRTEGVETVAGDDLHISSSSYNVDLGIQY